MKRADFNGDGFTDLAAGAPDAGSGHEGAVVVAYGGSGGVVPSGMETWSLDSPGVPGIAASDDGFGNALASADVNRDGFADLAIGVPSREIGGATDAGEVVLLRGSPSGLTGGRVVSEDTVGVPGAASNHDQFGAALGLGDFDGDGWPDLAVGDASKTVAGIAGAGAVHVLYGGPKGIGNGRARIFSRATSGVAGDPDMFALFGGSLGTGDLGKGTQADLVVGAERDRVGSVDLVGSVTVLFGGPTGLRASGSQRWTPPATGLTSGPRPEGFGWAMAIGDLGRSSDNDLAIGALAADVQGQDHAGAVYVLYGGQNGPTATSARRLTEATPGIPGNPAESDQFGAALAIANFDRSGRGDLAVAARYKRSAPAKNDSAGWVFVVPGGRDGVVPSSSLALSGVALSGQSSTDSLWTGNALTTGDFGGGPAPDLAVGIPGLHAGGVDQAGGVAILFGRLGGLGLSHKQLVDADHVIGFPSDLTLCGKSLIASPNVLD